MIDMQALRFVPVFLLSAALMIISSLPVRNKNKYIWLITSFILWLVSFLFAIGVFDK